jgi:hypothetical protein
VVVVSYTKLFDDRMKYGCLCTCFGDNCRCSGEILVRDKTGAFLNQLHHSVLNNDPSRDTIDLPDSFREDRTKLEQLPQDLKERFVNNLSKNQLNRAVEFAGFKGFDKFSPAALLTDVCFRILFQGSREEDFVNCFYCKFNPKRTTSDLRKKGASLFKSLTKLYDRFSGDEVRLLKDEAGKRGKETHLRIYPPSCRNLALEVQ